MNNPLLGAMMQNSPVNQFLQMANGGPQNILNDILSNNPRAGAFLRQMKGSCGAQDPKRFVLDYLEHSGADMNQVMALAQKMGLK